jgi:transcriptional regulator with XRE-family HTH domain
MNYGRGILSARTKLGMSKRKLATLAKLDPSYITRLEAGTKVPSLATVESISRALGMPVCLLMLASSDDNDLQGLRTTDAHELGNALEDLLRSAREPDDS